MSLFDIVTLFVFAQATAPAIPTGTIISNALTVIVTAPVTVGVVKYLDNRKAARERMARAELDAKRALALARAEDDTGRFEIETPIAERFANAERAERQEVQAKLEQKERTVRQLDRALAAAQEQVRILLENGREQERVIKNQANAILALYEHNEKLLAWINEHIERNPGTPPPPTFDHVFAIEEIVTSSKDDRRES
jgi:hypothetical protein